MSKNTKVFQGEREFRAPPVVIPSEIRQHEQQAMNGLDLLRALPPASFPLVFFDPQYRSVYKRQKYGNEASLLRGRGEQVDMDDDLIREFIAEIDRILMPRGHLMLWCDKFMLCSGGLKDWITQDTLNIVDMVTWYKEKKGLGYRTRRTAEHLMIYQKSPVRVKGVWMSRTIPDVWVEKPVKGHPHAKPYGLQKALIDAVTEPLDYVVDPASGGYSVFEASRATGRVFVGCDISEQPPIDTTRSDADYYEVCKNKVSGE